MVIKGYVYDTKTEDIRLSFEKDTCTIDSFGFRHPFFK